jgi:phosphinothricin acetyltransferase
MILPRASVRRATTDDLRAIHDIYESYVLHSTATYEETPPTWEQRLVWWSHHTHRYPVLVITSDDTLNAAVLGWASLSPFHERSAFQPTVENSIYIHPEHRGQGLGTRLLRQLILTAKSLDYTNIVALISSDQVASLRLHSAQGFVHAGQLSHVAKKFDQPLSLDFWQLRLRPLLA